MPSSRNRHESSVGPSLVLLPRLTCSRSFSRNSRLSTPLIDTAPAPVTPSQEPRYLLVSNGCVVCCLNLNKGQCQSLMNARDVPPFPKVTTLQLMDEHLPVSLGLFKSGSHQYMIGQRFSPSEEDPDECDDFLSIHDWGENPRGYYLYRLLCLQHFRKGTSRDTYCLSLNDGATLSHSKSNTIGKLNKPKFWPIVEKIKGHIHVFDSLPSAFCKNDNHEWIFSHEVLQRVSRSCSWIDIPTPDGEIYIRSHVLVGDFIFAVGGGMDLFFNSKTAKWRERPASSVEETSSATKVWHILQLGITRCAGEYPFPVIREAKVSDSLYVLVAFVEDDLYDECLCAVAYLVTSRGRIVCAQRLPHFYEKPVQPEDMIAGTIIDVDEEGKTMCSIVSGHGLLSGKITDANSNYLFINTYAVEMLADAAPKDQQVWAKGSKGWPVEQEFVRVDVKDRYIYKTDAKLQGEDDLPAFAGVQACFL